MHFAAAQLHNSLPPAPLMNDLRKQASGRFQMVSNNWYTLSLSSSSLQHLVNELIRIPEYCYVIMRTNACNDKREPLEEICHRFNDKSSDISMDAKVCKDAFNGKYCRFFLSLFPCHRRHSGNRMFMKSSLRSYNFYYAHFRVYNFFSSHF